MRGARFRAPANPRICRIPDGLSHGISRDGVKSRTDMGHSVRKYARSCGGDAVTTHTIRAMVALKASWSARDNDASAPKKKK